MFNIFIQMSLNSLILSEITGDLGSAGFDDIYSNGILVGLSMVVYNFANNFMLSAFDLKNLLIFFNFVQLGCWFALIAINELGIES